MKAVRSSPLRTGRVHPQEFSWYTVLEAESTPGRMVPSVASEKIPGDTTGDRSRGNVTSTLLKSQNPQSLQHSQAEIHTTTESIHS
jgi:hypothetical protein